MEKNPFHKTKSTEFGGVPFSMKCLGDTSLNKKAGTLKKVECLLTLILGGVQGKTSL
jgi:hypothetical protein